MKLAPGCSALLLFATVLGPSLAFAAEPADPAPEPSISVAAVPPVRALYVRPEFAGSYRPDGTFAQAGSRAVAFDAAAARTRDPRLSRPAEVPPWVNLHPIERVVQDKAYRRATFTPKSKFASFLDNVLTAAYGRESVLRAPAHLTTDSRQRLIIADAEVPAVHVLDGKNSFRIEGGPGRRMRRPSGVAVDAEDNIYVSDERQRVILVYDSEGVYRRALGIQYGENMFEKPAGLAIDRSAGHVYVLDSAAGELAVLLLDGKVLKQVGGPRSQGIRFDNPTQVAVGADRVAVLDASGSRIRVFSLDCDLLSEFRIRGEEQPPMSSALGLGIDAGGHIYVTNVMSDVRVYTQDGKLIDRLEQSRSTHEGFRAPEGVWIDDSGRMFVADTRNRRIQVFTRSQEGIVNPK
ncbi:MAG TPA: hypothetical protein VEG32_03370 [Clostridia bacterium]|nr:hypothetical protein [Clostridia bacterium]